MKIAKKINFDAQKISDTIMTTHKFLKRVVNDWYKFNSKKLRHAGEAIIIYSNWY